MLAALLLNLGTAPAAPPAALGGFGGGPFWKRYGYDPRYYKQDDDDDEELETVAPPIPARATAAIQRAVAAIREAPEPERIVIEAGEVYARALRALDADMDATRIERQWEREVKRQLRQAQRQAAEDEEIMIVSLLSH